MTNKLDETKPIVINGTLRNWTIVVTLDGESMFCGKIYGDTKGRFRDGEYIYTSAIIEGPTPLGYVMTKNSTYFLEPDKKPTKDLRQGVEL